MPVLAFWFALAENHTEARVTSRLLTLVYEILVYFKQLHTMMDPVDKVSKVAQPVKSPIFFHCKVAYESKLRYVKGH